MLTDKQIYDAAERLQQAELSRQQIRQFSLEYPGITIDDGYGIQSAWIKAKVSQGRRIIGHKIGLTSRAMQQSSQIDEPDYGTLLDDMLFADSADIPMQRFIEPRVEVELAFILKEQLHGDKVTILDVLNATDYVMPALEIIDARIQRIDPDSGRSRKVMDTISDNAANAGVVMGGRPMPPADVDLRWAAALLYRNSRIEETGVAAGVLNHPANGIAWLARKFSPHGIVLQPGQIILSGSFTRPVFAHAGDTFHVDYGLLGAVGCRFI